MDDQADFDFGHEGPLSSFSQPAGTWLVQEFTAEEHTTRLQDAEACAVGLVPVLAALYMRGIHAARAELERLAKVRVAGEAFGLHAISVTAFSHELYELQHQDLGADIEIKSRCNTEAGQMLAVFAQHVGTLAVRSHADGSRSIGYAHYRSADMLPSYRDDKPVYELPEAIWGPAYASQAIAEAGDGIARLKTFRHGGREWINDGGMYFSGNASCEGWAIARRAYWESETYSYRDQVAAWDAGTLERGDRRGLVVKVRGLECVLTGAGTFAANKPSVSAGMWEPELGSRVRAKRKRGIRSFDDFALLVKRRDVVQGHVIFTCETTGPVTRKKRRNGSTYSEFPQWQGFYEASDLQPAPKASAQSLIEPSRCASAKYPESV